MPPSIGNSGRVTLTGLQVAADASDAAEARAALSAAVEVIEVPLDDSWMRDNGPIFALDGSGCRAGIHFGFNAWGGKFEGWERDEAAGGMLAHHVTATSSSGRLWCLKVGVSASMGPAACR